MELLTKFKNLVTTALRLRNTPIVDDDFPDIRDEFDGTLNECRHFLDSFEPVKDAAMPDHMIEDSRGAWRPKSSIKPIDLLRDELVQRIATNAQFVNQMLTHFKQQTFVEIAAFVELSAAEYDVKLGGEKGNVTLTSYDGRFKVMRALHDSISFNEKIYAAKELIDECLRDWTGRPGVPQGLVAIVNTAFKRNSNGEISVSRIMELRTYDIADDRWKNAMDIIADSINVLGTITYLRVLQRKGRTDKYELIPLDVAGV